MLGRIKLGESPCVLVGRGKNVVMDQDSRKIDRLCLYLDQFTFWRTVAVEYKIYTINTKGDVSLAKF